MLNRSGFCALEEKTAPKTAPKRKRFMRATKYKNINIIRARSGDWRIRYEFEIPNKPGVFKKFYVRDGVNYVHDLPAKEKAINQLREDIEFHLKKGYNPFEAERDISSLIEEKEVEIEEAEKVDFWMMSEAIDKYIRSCEKKNLSPNTIRTYQTFINNFEAWLFSYDLIQKKACDFTTNQLEQFLDESFDAEEWSPRTYNNHIAFFGTFFKQVFKLERRVNPEVRYVVIADDIEKKKDRAERNKYYTPSIATKIKKELSKLPDLYNYCKWIYYSCMRPREISLLQVQHIDLETRQIKVIAPTAKTGDRFVPICDELFDLIIKMKLTEAEYGSYVFGKNGKTSREKIYKDHFRNLYRPIKLLFGLDDNYTLYGWKHSRVVDLLNAGFTDPEVMSLTGHRDYKGFQAYKRGFVLDNTVMKGKTVGF